MTLKLSIGHWFFIGKGFTHQECAIDNLYSLLMNKILANELVTQTATGT